MSAQMADQYFNKLAAQVCEQWDRFETMKA
jgi:hypothetical protein